MALKLRFQSKAAMTNSTLPQAVGNSTIQDARDAAENMRRRIPGNANLPIGGFSPGKNANREIGVPRE